MPEHLRFTVSNVYDKKAKTYRWQGFCSSLGKTFQTEETTEIISPGKMKGKTFSKGKSKGRERLWTIIKEELGATRHWRRRNKWLVEVAQ